MGPAHGLALDSKAGWSQPLSESHQNNTQTHNFWDTHYPHFTKREIEVWEVSSACPKYTQLVSSGPMIWTCTCQKLGEETPVNSALGSQGHHRQTPQSKGLNNRNLLLSILEAPDQGVGGLMCVLRPLSLACTGPPSLCPQVFSPLSTRSSVSSS